MDGMYFKSRENGKVSTKVLYNILGINQEGYKVPVRSILYLCPALRSRPAVRRLSPYRSFTYCRRSHNLSITHIAPGEARERRKWKHRNRSYSSRGFDSLLGKANHHLEASLAWIRVILFMKCRQQVLKPCDRVPRYCECWRLRCCGTNYYPHCARRNLLRHEVI